SLTNSKSTSCGITMPPVRPRIACALCMSKTPKDLSRNLYKKSNILSFRLEVSESLELVKVYKNLSEKARVLLFVRVYKNLSKCMSV
ncbi:Hypothetical predicted protein, partial [Olea europaea subsp. europaea]